MSEKIYLRKVERYTVWQATEPIEIDVDKLRECDPPYKGDSNSELLDYLETNVYQNYDWSETNGDVYGEDESYSLTLDDCEYNEPYSDTREKYEDSWIEIGVPNDEYRKVGRFEVKVDNMSKNDW